MRRPERFLRLKAVEEATGLKKPTLYKLMDLEQFPRPVPLTDNSGAVGWPESKIAEWQQDRIRRAGGWREGSHRRDR